MECVEGGFGVEIECDRLGHASRIVAQVGPRHKDRPPGWPSPAPTGEGTACLTPDRVGTSRARIPRWAPPPHVCSIAGAAHCVLKAVGREWLWPGPLYRQSTKGCPGGADPGSMTSASRLPKKDLPPHPLPPLAGQALRLNASFNIAESGGDGVGNP